MLEWFNNTILFLADPMLNWLLRLPMDWALVIVAVGTGSIITFSRRFTTNQDLLRRCDQDKQRLKELVREAKKRKDKEAIARYRSTKNMIGLTTMRQEGWPLLVVLLPIAILGTWCFQRLAFVPPKAGETVSIQAYFPVSAVGELAHIVPQKGLTEVTRTNAGASGCWIQEIVTETDPKTGAAVGAVATWQLKADASTGPYRLQIRHKTGTVTKELLVGQAVYSQDVEFYGADQPIQSVQIGMKPVKFLGLVPGIRGLSMPPWMVAYFLIAIPSVSLIKRVAKVY
jgi:uncharacterized membrane protein (DUF106 family)